MTVGYSKETASDAHGAAPAAVLLAAALATSALGFYHPAFFIGTIAVLVLSCRQLRKSRSWGRGLTVSAIAVCAVVVLVAVAASAAVFMA